MGLHFDKSVERHVQHQLTRHMMMIMCECKELLLHTPKTASTMLKLLLSPLKPCELAEEQADHVLLDCHMLCKLQAEFIGALRHTTHIDFCKSQQALKY